MRHIVVCNPAGAVLATVAGKGRVVLGQFRVLGDDVPCVQEPWHESEEAKSDVDQRVGTAETALDPDWGNGRQLGIRMGLEAQLPAMGGNRMAISPRNMSPEHIAL
jgi:hypothetical protein